VWDIKLILDDRGRDKLALNAEYIVLMNSRTDIPLEMWRIIVEIYSGGFHGGVENHSRNLLWWFS
jgi:hypothetical protein